LCAVHTCYRINNIFQRKPYEAFERDHPRSTLRADGGKPKSH
jgi:hypothetical protein